MIVLMKKKKFNHDTIYHMIYHMIFIIKDNRLTRQKRMDDNLKIKVKFNY